MAETIALLENQLRKLEKENETLQTEMKKKTIVKLLVVKQMSKDKILK